MRLLVVEDDARIASFLTKGLRAEGHVVLVAEFVADTESGLIGKRLHDIEIPGEVRVIAIRTKHAHDYQWRPDHARRLEAGDKYVLLATRAGLGRHTSRVS